MNFPLRVAGFAAFVAIAIPAVTPSVEYMTAGRDAELETTLREIERANPSER
jgi:hypothetical protein